MVKTKIKDIFYLYHPNAVQDDTEPKGYKDTGGGKWVVEWDIYKCPITLSRDPEHHIKAFKTESEAKDFYWKLMLRYERQEKKKLG